MSGERLCSVSLNDGAAAPNTKPIRPIADPPPERRAAAARRASARTARRGPGRTTGHAAATGSACVAPRSRRANATTPTANRATASDDGRDERRPVEAADERLVVDGPAAPGQVRERREGRCRVLVAVGEVAEQERRPRRSPPTAPRPTNGRQRERDRSRRQRDDADPRGRTRTATSTRSRRPGACRTSPRRTCMSAVDEDDDRHPGQVRGELLERDPALAERRRRDELEAPAAGLARRACPDSARTDHRRGHQARATRAVFQAMEPPSVSMATGNGLPYTPAIAGGRLRDERRELRAATRRVA